jgi:hypothetical protein
MQAPEIANNTTGAIPVPPGPDQELFLLETLKSLLDGAIDSLSGGDAESLLEMSRQITSTAQQLLALCLQGGHLSLTAEAQQRRRKLLAELTQQRAFCRAMLRRWRRSLALRQQLLALHSEPVAYTASWLEAGVR